MSFDEQDDEDGRYRFYGCLATVGISLLIWVGVAVLINWML